MSSPISEALQVWLDAGISTYDSAVHGCRSDASYVHDVHTSESKCGIPVARHFAPLSIFPLAQLPIILYNKLSNIR